MRRKRIAVLTGGGDCPGLNAAIRMVVKKAVHAHGMEVLGFLNGWDGPMSRNYRELDFSSVSDIQARGGTVLGSSNRAHPFEHRTYDRKGSCTVGDVSDEVIAYCHDLGLDALICIGGDGTQSIARRFVEKGLPVVGIPKTIDNDLMGTECTIGFSTAVERIRGALDHLKTTAESHNRIQVLETMGRYAGWLALYGGAAVGADVILIPEIPFNLHDVCDAIRARRARNRTFSLVVIAEGAKPEGGEMVVKRTVSDSPDPIRLGGVGQMVAGRLEEALSMEARVTVLGHVQRGGPPTAEDRILAGLLASHAVDLVANERYGRMAAIVGGAMTDVSFAETGPGNRPVPPTHELILAERAIGTCFGDAQA